MRLRGKGVLFYSGGGGGTSIVLAFPVIFEGFSDIRSSLSIASLFEASFSACGGRPSRRTFLLESAICKGFSRERGQRGRSVLLIRRGQRFDSFLVRILSRRCGICAMSGTRSVYSMVHGRQPRIMLLTRTFSVVSKRGLYLRVGSSIGATRVPIVLFGSPIGIKSSSREITSYYLTLPLSVSHLQMRVGGLVFGHQVVEGECVALMLNNGSRSGSSLRSTFSKSRRGFLSGMQELIRRGLSGPSFGISVLDTRVGVDQSNFCAEVGSVARRTPTSCVHAIGLGGTLVLLVDGGCAMTRMTSLANFDSPGCFQRIFGGCCKRSPGGFIGDLWPRIDRVGVHMGPVEVCTSFLVFSPQGGEL